MNFTEEEIKLIQSALKYYALGSLLMTHGQFADGLILMMKISEEEFQSDDEDMALWVKINKIVEKLTEKK